MTRCVCPSRSASASPDGRSLPQRPSTSLDGSRLTAPSRRSCTPTLRSSSPSPQPRRTAVTLALVPAAAPGVELEAEPSLDLASRPFTVTSTKPRRSTSSQTSRPPRSWSASRRPLRCSPRPRPSAPRRPFSSLARDYAAGRRQFGHTIGSFQAVRHMLADMVMSTESAWSSVLYAAASLDEATRTACRRPRRQGVGIARDARGRPRGSAGLRRHRLHR